MGRLLAGLLMAENNNEGSPLLWLWIVVAVIGIVAVSMLVARRSGRRPVVRAGWHTKLVDAYAKGSALHNSMSLAESPGGPAITGEEATNRWAGIQRRADDLTQDLCNLRETAPNEMERSHVADVLASLQAVRSALDTERRAGDPDRAGGSRPGTGGQVHDLLLSFETSLRALR
jgi:hypothetical protein